MRAKVKLGKVGVVKKEKKNYHSLNKTPSSIKTSLLTNVVWGFQGFLFMLNPGVFILLRLETREPSKGIRKFEGILER